MIRYKLTKREQEKKDMLINFIFNQLPNMSDAECEQYDNK